MKNIKSFDDLVVEGLFDGLKASYRMTKMNGFVFDRSAELIEKNKDKYKSAADTLPDIKADAKKQYAELMKGLDDVLPFEKWWRDFTEKFEKMQ